ncbi:MAG: hypothetical protein NTW28_26350 [Candidatus Solibacter sp.]|nr:hypothetical protein [Candidatus Solibacter sp.]
MANTEVRVSIQGEAWVPNVSSVPIIPGDSVTFFAVPDAQTKLCMTADTAAVLTPHPDLTVMIDAGGSTTFGFLAAAAGNYCMLTQAPDCPCPNSISCGAGGSYPVLSIRPGSGPVFSGPDDDTKT